MINICNLCRYYYSLTHSLTCIPDSRDLRTRKRERERVKEKKSHKRKERNSGSGNKQRTSF